MATDLIGYHLSCDSVENYKEQTVPFINPNTTMRSSDTDRPKVLVLDFRKHVVFLQK